MKRLPHVLILWSDEATQKGSLESFKALFEEKSQFFSSFLENFLTLGVKYRSYMFLFKRIKIIFDSEILKKGGAFAPSAPPSLCP